MLSFKTAVLKRPLKVYFKKYKEQSLNGLPKKTYPGKNLTLGNTF